MRTLALFAVFAFAGCTKAPPSNQPPTASETDSSDPGAAESGGSGLVEGEPAAAGDSGEDSSEDSGEDGERTRPGPALPDGPLCDTTADCGAGMVCEGLGCEPGQGRCVSQDRMCTRDLASYCGCDGQTFQTSGSCPGARYAYRGACDVALEDGEACTDGRQCKSGGCIGEGLEGCSPGAQGVCGAAACTKDLASYCGCNNVEFRGSGSCPNRQFAYRGPCEG